MFFFFVHRTQNNCYPRNSAQSTLSFEEGTGLSPCSDLPCGKEEREDCKRRVGEGEGEGDGEGESLEITLGQDSKALSGLVKNSSRSAWHAVTLLSD